MKLAQTILENERNGNQQKNKQLIERKLKELVYTYPNEVSQVLIKTGVQLRSDFPPAVLLVVVIKHIHKNSELRDAVSKMILEMDGYYNSDGRWTGIIGGALSAVGSVLSGIGQGQFNNSNQQQQFQLEQQRMQLAAEQERLKRRSRGWIIFGVSLVMVAGIIAVIAMIKKSKKKQAMSKTTELKQLNTQVA